MGGDSSQGDRRAIKQAVVGEGQPPDPKLSGKQRRPEAPPPTTLFLYYSERTARPAPFLNHLSREGIPAFSPEDEDQVLPALGQLDPEFRKTLALAHRAAASFRTPAAALCLDWIGRVVVSWLQQSYNWAPTPNEAPAETLSDILDRTLPLSRDKAAARRALTFLMTLCLWLSLRRNLDTVDIVAVLRRRVMGARDKPSPASEVARKALLHIAKPPVALRPIRSILETIELWERRALDARSEMSRAKEEVERQRQRIEGLTTSIEANEKTIADLSGQVQSAQQLHSDIQEQQRQGKIVAQHSLSALRSRERAFLDRKLRSLLDTALEAARMTPPRLAVLTERLEILSQAVEEELRWLASSD